MDYRNGLLDEWVGTSVRLIELGTPQTPDDAAIEGIWKEPGSVLAAHPLGTQTSIRLLESYDQVGIIVRTLEEGAPRAFVPWGAVLNIMGGFEAAEGV